MKNRISLIEIGFREKEEEVKAADCGGGSLDRAPLFNIPRRSGMTVPGDRAAGMRARNALAVGEFASSVLELNERMKRARYALNYHNGFIQRVGDDVIGVTIEQPFWDIVSDPLWKNVDIDMKEAVDRRDTDQRDPVFYAVRALESAIMIISDVRRLSTGRENEAHNFIDNLASEKANHFIERWEADMLKALFTNVRNPLGHGPGADELPQLSGQQTNWTIENCMS